jgi:4-amino-4-deoxy-L-arabinose transferase-like glycosyltransferase
MPAAKSKSARAKTQNAAANSNAPAPRRALLHRAAVSLPLILLVCLLLRVGFAFDYAGQNTRQALSVAPFLFESGNIAQSLAAGNGFSNPFHMETGPTAWMTPVYPLVLAGIFRLLGTYTFDAFVAAVAFNILCVTLTCVPIYFAGKRIGGLALGALAAWLWAIFPNAIQIPVESMWDASLDALLAATILWATLALADSRRFRDWCAYGLLWGLTLMTNPTLSCALPFLFLWLAFRARSQSRPWHETFRHVAASLALAALCCVPWTARNYSAFHTFIPTRSILGLQLAMGNNATVHDYWLGEGHPIHEQSEREKYIEMGEVPYMQEKEHEAIEYIVSHPAREAHLMSRRFIYIWTAGTPYPLRALVRVKSYWFRGVLLFNIALSLLMLWGMIWLARRRSTYTVPLAVFPLIYPWAYYLTLALPRYRFPIDPIIVLLAGVGALALARSSGRNAAQPAPATHLA